MNEELIRQCAREGAASEYEALGLIGMASNFLSGAMDDATDVRSAERAIRLYHARAVAPLLEALKPFALIAELDIGDDEVDSDLFRPLTHNHAPHITVGHLRAALAALAPFQQEGK